MRILLRRPYFGIKQILSRYKYGKLRMEDKKKNHWKDLQYERKNTNQIKCFGIMEAFVNQERTSYEQRSERRIALLINRTGKRSPERL